jgi:hypothetical protein
MGFRNSLRIDCYSNNFCFTLYEDKLLIINLLKLKTMSLLQKFCNQAIGMSGGQTGQQQQVPQGAKELQSVFVSITGGLAKAGGTQVLRIYLNGAAIYQCSQTLGTDLTTFETTVHPTYYGNPYPVNPGDTIETRIIFAAQVIPYGTLAFQFASTVG